jgi:hypothetical protein
MRPLTIALLLFALAGCSKSPQDKRADEIRSEAGNQSAVIENKGDQEADGLEKQADLLRNEAKQTGGLSGDRMKVRSDAMAKEARLIRKQADLQADALREAADAKVKAIKSR